MDLIGFKTNPIKNKIQLATFNGGATPTWPTTFYIALHTTGGIYWPTRAGSILEINDPGLNPPKASNYKRIAIANTSANWTVNSTGNVVNANQINLPRPGLHLDNSTVTATTPAASSNVITFSSGFTVSPSDVGGSFVVTGGTNINTGTYTVQSVSGQSWTVSGSTTLTTATGPGSAIVGSMAATWIVVTGVALFDAATGGTMWYGAYHNPTTFNQNSTPYFAAGALVIQE